MGRHSMNYEPPPGEEVASPGEASISPPGVPYEPGVPGAPVPPSPDTPGPEAPSTVPVEPPPPFEPAPPFEPGPSEPVAPHEPVEPVVPLDPLEPPPFAPEESDDGSTPAAGAWHSAPTEVL
jgi:hypothetical protein